MTDFLSYATLPDGTKKVFRIKSRNTSEARIKLIKWLLQGKDHVISRKQYEAERAFLEALGIDPYPWQDNGYGEPGDYII